MRAQLVRSAPPWSRRAALAPALIVLCAAGCGSPGTSGRLAPSGSLDNGAAAGNAAAPSTVPTDQLYRTVLDRYRAYQAAYKKAYATNDPGELEAVAMDPLLTQVTEDVEATKAKGQIWRFTNTFNPRVYARSKDTTKIYVIDCVRTLVAHRYSAKTGERTGGVPSGAYVYRATLQYDSGIWKVAANVRDSACR